MMASSASLKITLRDGSVKCFTEPVGKDNTVDYEEMDKALLRLQEQSNSLLTVHVEKEKEISLNSSGQKNGGGSEEEDDDEDNESSDGSDGKEDNDDQGKPPEKKPRT